MNSEHDRNTTEKTTENTTENTTTATAGLDTGLDAARLCCIAQPLQDMRTRMNATTTAMPCRTCSLLEALPAIYSLCCNYDLPPHDTLHAEVSGNATDHVRLAVRLSFETCGDANAGESDDNLLLANE